MCTQLVLYEHTYASGRKALLDEFHFIHSEIWGGNLWALKGFAIHKITPEIYSNLQWRGPISFLVTFSLSLRLHQSSTFPSFTHLKLFVNGTTEIIVARSWKGGTGARFLADSVAREPNRGQTSTLTNFPKFETSKGPEKFKKNEKNNSTLTIEQNYLRGRTKGNGTLQTASLVSRPSGRGSIVMSRWEARRFQNSKNNIIMSRPLAK